MKKILVVLALVLSVFAFSQVRQPAKWSNSLSEDNPEIGDTIQVLFNAKVEADWYLYSSDFDPDLGPNVTEFEFEPHESYELVGGITPVNPKTGYDSIFEGEYTYFRGEGQFIQNVLIKNKNYQIKGYFTGQTCSDISGLCITFDEEFEFSGKEESTSEGVNVPVEKSVEKEGLLQTRDTHDPYSLLSFMLVAFLAGLAALLTPCVFPMIPMTVTYFSKKPGRVRNSLLYGISIIVIYVLIG